MPMELDHTDSRGLKARARARMYAARPPFWRLTLVFLLLTTGVSTAAGVSGATDFSLPMSSGDTFSLFLSLLILLYTAVMDFGYQIWALRTSRGQEAGYNALIDGFGMAGRVVLMELAAWFCRLVWTVALATLLAALLMFLALLLPGSAAGMLLLWGAGLAGVLAIGMWVTFRYAMAPFLLADRPEEGPLAAVRGSAALMRGRMWSMFRMSLSFLGFYLLVLVLGMGVELAFVLPAVLQLAAAAAADPAALLADPAVLLAGLAIPWFASLLSTLVQLPLLLWLKPYYRVTCACFYQALLQEEAPPVWDGGEGY